MPWVYHTAYTQPRNVVFCLSCVVGWNVVLCHRRIYWNAFNCR